MGAHKGVSKAIAILMMREMFGIFFDKLFSKFNLSFVRPICSSLV